MEIGRIQQAVSNMLKNYRGLHEEIVNKRKRLIGQLKSVEKDIEHYWGAIEALERVWDLVHEEGPRSKEGGEK